MTQTRAGLLTTNHTGKTVTVTGGGATVTGVLLMVSHKRDMIDDRRMGAAVDDPQIVPGRAWTVVTILPDLELILRPDSLVEVAE
ncbi:hypothetical protein FQ154_01690 [Paeniglutamicibacter gangotriensis]|uniref:Uncharacterized protein n=1 Tax=Paeniglutamicibacter gangotriensis TaxID=254787 RepID=A0A5B0ELK5_9MICC|nr:hypothetical protein [Paeniglutamicibacter gangotriensis]KAA0979897.1 hypothetical protein FQ154_01690 [Paeniglutamicibacter gangotriensis]